jgi:tellurite resistance protein TehA-like permease
VVIILFFHFIYIFGRIRYRKTGRKSSQERCAMGQMRIERSHLMDECVSIWIFINNGNTLIL